MKKMFSQYCFSLLTLLRTFSGVHCATLTLTSQPQTSGTYCPGPVNFTCMGTELSLIFWEMNGTTVATYLFRAGDTFPLSLALNPPLPGVTAVVTTASANPNVNFDIISMLCVSDVSVLNGTSLLCAESRRASNMILIGVIPTPTPSPIFSAPYSLLPASGGAEVSLQWSPSFTSQYAVERYRVSVNPDPSSCSSEQVSPSEDYSCSGLVLGTLYTFTVSAINCGDQEGDRNEFNISLCEGSTADIFKATALYDRDSSDLLSITVLWPLHILDFGRNIIPCSEENNTFVSFDSTTITIEDLNRRRVQTSFMPTEADCDFSSSTCSALFPILYDEDSYVVSIGIVDTQGRIYNETQIISGTLNRQLVYTLYLSGTSVYALCSSLIAGVNNCSIQYTTDSSYENLSPPVSGPINTPFPIAPVTGITSSVYYHQASVIVNSSLKVVIRSSQVFIPAIDNSPTTSAATSSATSTLLPNSPSETTDAQLGIIGAVVAVLLVAVAVSIGFIICLIWKVKKRNTETSSEGGAESANKVQRSKTCDLKLPEINPTTADVTRKETKVIRNHTESVVYDEIKDYMIPPHCHEKTKSTDIELIENSAYHAPNIQTSQDHTAVLTSDI